MKRKATLTLVICSVTLAVTAVALVVMSMFVLKVSAAVPVVCAAAAVIFMAAAAILSEKKKVRGIVSAAMAVVLSAALVMGFFWNPYANSVTFRSYDFTLGAGELISSEQAQADIRQAYALLKKVHPAFKDGAPAETEQAFEAVLAEVAQRDSVSCAEERRYVQRVLSTLGDAHTASFAFPSEERYLCDYGELVKGGGYAITEINGEPLQDWFSGHRELFSYEAESWAVDQLKKLVTSDTGLAFLGIVDEEFTLTYEREGERLERVYSPEELISYDDYMERNGQYYDNQSESFVRYELFPEENYALLTLDSCNYNSEYTNTLKEMFDKLYESEIEHLIVDLRKNSGGDDRVAEELMRYLGVESYRGVGYRQRWGQLSFEHRIKDEPIEYAGAAFDGDVTLLTSTGSFSSAMLFALYFKDNSLGTIVGETPGNSANGFGEIATFQLDNSGIILSVSTKEFFRADSAAGDFVIPDVRCESGAALETALGLF